MQPSYQISTGKIAHERIDGEVIVIHYDTGDYYSMTGTAAVLWEMMLTPQSLDRIRARFAGWDSRAEAAMSRFLDVLLGEGLIQVAQGAAAGGNGAVSSLGDDRLVFRDPVIEKYSDMKTILLADPIHDVEEEGWPKIKAQG